MRVTILFVLSIGLILTGLALVSASSTSGIGGDCFFWPFPVIIACGAGSGGSGYLPIILGIVALVVTVLFTVLWRGKTEG